MKELARLQLMFALVVALFAAALPVYAMPTPLTAGDIAIIGFNSDHADQIAFVLLVDVETGTEISFTHNGWRRNNRFRTGEGSFTWTAGMDLTAGTIVIPSVSGVALSTSGDQMLAYQGTSSNPTFLYAVNNEGAPLWQPDATSSTTSALPGGLVNSTSALALNEVDNAKYIGPTTGTKEQLQTAIGNIANWAGSNSIRQTMPTTSFTVQNGAHPNCPSASITSIGAIQGTGASTPMNGQEVTIRGVVIADFQEANELSGFFVQDEAQLDGDPYLFEWPRKRNHSLSIKITGAGI